ncbi:MAG: exodeoxyribonuclease VII large subunit [Alcanivoracaceae bacterium]
MSEITPPNTAERDIWSVSRLNLEAQGVLESSFPLIWLEGELSNLSRPASGHMYFSLKDSRAQVNAAMFRGNNRRLRFQPRNGQQVLVRARVTLYQPRGNFQLIVEHMEEAGEGALRRQFDALKAKLDGEGLFDPSRKRPLPPLPAQIGVITSASGAALRDILHVLARRCPQIPVLVYPAAVQGQDAPAQLRQALALANARAECDLLILARGGGSLEDLWSFNDEALARDVAASTLPVISAVGHEIDFSLTDFVADVRAPTPSAAAELAGPDMATREARLDVARRRLANAIQRQLQQQQGRLESLGRRVRDPRRQLEEMAQRLDDLGRRARQRVTLTVQVLQQRLVQLQRRLTSQRPERRLTQASQRLAGLQRRLAGPVPRQLAHQRQFLGQLAQRLQTASPLATLDRGYSITFSADGQDQALRSVKSVTEGQALRTRLADGDILSRVERIKPSSDTD